MMRRCLVRAASRDDLDTLCALNHGIQSLHHENMPWRFKPPSDDPACRKHFEDLLANPDCGVLLACCDGEAAGYAAYEIKKSSETAFTYAYAALYVHHVCVKPEFHHRGIGSSLMEALEAQAHDRGVDMVQLDFWTFNQQARAFYQRLGYQSYNERWWKLIR